MNSEINNRGKQPPAPNLAVMKAPESRILNAPPSYNSKDASASDQGLTPGVACSLWLSGEGA